MKLTLGIDPGLTGALSLLEDGKFILAVLMPILEHQDRKYIDHAALKTWLTETLKQNRWVGADVSIWIERAQIRPMRGGKPCHRCKRPVGGPLCPVCHQAPPDRGIVASARTVGMYEFIRGILIGMGFKVKTVAAQTWTQIFKELQTPGEGKERAVNLCRQLWPDADFRASERARIPHSGKCDATIISYYGWRSSASEVQF